MKLENSPLKTKIIFDELVPEYTAKDNIINKDMNIEQKLIFNNNNKQIQKKYGNKYNNNSLNNLKNHHFININYLLLTLIILLFSLPMILTKESKLRELTKDSEIIISIRGSGNKYILNQYYNNLPSQVFINKDEQKQISEDNLYNLPDGEISVKLIWSYPLSNCVNMFKDLSDILSINFVKFDTSLVTEMNGMFMGCTSLVSLDLTQFDSKNVNNMIDMFNRCSSLKSINLDNFSTSSCTMMNAMFYGCSSLQSINLDSFDTSKVISMESIFMECTSLTSLDLKGINTKSLVRMGDMFNDCASLTFLDLSNFDTKSVN
jgi:surface protein